MRFQQRIAILQFGQICDLPLKVVVLAIALAFEKFHKLWPKLLHQRRLPAQYHVPLSSIATSHALRDGKEIEYFLWGVTQKCVDEVYFDAVTAMQCEVFGSRGFW